MLQTYEAPQTINHTPPSPEVMTEAITQAQKNGLISPKASKVFKELETHPHLIQAVLDTLEGKENLRPNEARVRIDAQRLALRQQYQPIGAPDRRV